MGIFIFVYVLYLVLFYSTLFHGFLQFPEYLSIPQQMKQVCSCCDRLVIFQGYIEAVFSQCQVGYSPSLYDPAKDLYFRKWMNG